MLSQPIIANCSIEAFNIGVLLGLARLNVFQFDSALLCPSHHGSTDVLGAVVHNHGFGLAMIWLSVNLDCFIAELSSSMVENSTFNPDYL